MRKPWKTLINLSFSFSLFFCYFINLKSKGVVMGENHMNKRESEKERRDNRKHKGVVVCGVLIYVVLIRPLSLSPTLFVFIIFLGFQYLYSPTVARKETSHRIVSKCLQTN